MDEGQKEKVAYVKEQDTEADECIKKLILKDGGLMVIGGMCETLMTKCH